MAKTDEALRKAADLTPKALTGMTPPQADTLRALFLGALSETSRAEAYAYDSLHDALGEKQEKKGRGKVWPTTDDEARQEATRRLGDGSLGYYETTRVRKALEVVELAERDRPVLTRGVNLVDAERTRRGGWSRFLIVTNTGGHIHDDDRNCFTLCYNTQIAHLPKLSGLTEADAVKAHGTILCSHCFPSAPVEWTVGLPKSKGECPGSRKAADMPDYMRYRVRKYATCPDCGREDVAVTPNFRLRAHKPKEAEQTVPAPAPEKPKKAKPGPSPTAGTVGGLLAAAGFRKGAASTARRLAVPGFLVTSLQPGSATVRHVVPEQVGMRDEEEAARQAHAWLSAYALVLSARYDVTTGDGYLVVRAREAMPERPKWVPAAEGVLELIRRDTDVRANWKHTVSKPREYDTATVLQQPDHTLITVVGSGGFDEKESAAARAERITAAVQGTAWKVQPFPFVGGVFLVVTFKSAPDVFDPAKDAPLAP